MNSIQLVDIWARLGQLVRLEHPFALWSLLAALVIGVVCGLVGTFLVLRGMSLIGDAVGHATLPGVGAGFLIFASKVSWIMMLSATVTAVIAAWLVAFLDRGERTRSDAAIAIVIAGAFGLGLIFMAIAQGSPTGAQAGLNTIFFGNVAATRPEDVWTILGVSSVLTSVLFIYWRPISLSIFDRSFAESIGIEVKRIDTLLLIMLAVSVVISIEAVGVVLVASMLIIPATTARIWTDSLGVMGGLSSIFGGVCGVIGAVISYLFEGVSTGPAMVLCGAVLFGGTVMLKESMRLFRRFGGARVEVMG